MRQALSILLMLLMLLPEQSQSLDWGRVEVLPDTQAMWFVKNRMKYFGESIDQVRDAAMQKALDGCNPGDQWWADMEMALGMTNGTLSITALRAREQQPTWSDYLNLRQIGARGPPADLVAGPVIGRRIATPTPSAGGSTTLLLDESGLGSAAAAYSVRKLRAAYAGSALRVRRASDSTEQDIGFSGNNLDTASLASFCSGTDGFVVTWYDQSGNARNATQATASLQPKIVSSGTVITGSNSKPAAQGDGSDDRLVASFTLNSGATCHVIFNATGGAANFSICDGATGNTQRILKLDVGSLHKAGANEIGDGTSNSFVLNTWYLDSFVRNGASSKVSFNGGSDFTGTCGTGAAGGVTLFNFGGGGGAMAGKIHEYVVWASALSDANRTTAKSNQNTYYAIY